MITSSRFQDPPIPSRTSQSATGKPPVTSVFFNLSVVKKPIKRLSGDQNGYFAPSEPASGLASPVARASVQSCIVLPVYAVNASQAPSGEAAMYRNFIFSGSESESFNGREYRAGGRVKYAHARPAATSDTSTVAVIHHFSRPFQRGKELTVLTSDQAVCSRNRAPEGVNNASSANPRSLAL